MNLGKRAVTGDVVQGYRFAWLPTKVVDQRTQSGYWVWLERYYLWKKKFQGNVSSYWEIRKFINYDPDRFDKIMKRKGLR